MKAIKIQNKSMKQWNNQLLHPVSFHNKRVYLKRFLRGEEMERWQSGNVFFFRIWRINTDERNVESGVSDAGGTEGGQEVKSKASLRRSCRSSSSGPSGPRPQRDPCFQAWARKSSANTASCQRLGQRWSFLLAAKQQSELCRQETGSAWDNTAWRGPGAQLHSSGTKQGCSRTWSFPDGHRKNELSGRRRHVHSSTSSLSFYDSNQSCGCSSSSSVQD